jgi:para-nitrobenzyl esterase
LNSSGLLPRAVTVFFYSLLLAAASGKAVAAQDPSVVITDRGPVRGTIVDDVLQFRGIPYAASPSGELRWKLPVAHAAWSGVLDASHFGPGCPQVARYGLTEAGYNEDCLSVNVTVPYKQIAPGKKLPVIVWIYGGAFVGGSSSLYDLTHWAKLGDVVLVSINYRLGVFGFMAHPAFDPDSNGEFGQADQREALRWVKRNIAAFGGDANNITLAGESAGAASTCFQMLAPEAAKGLFHKAIIQSAGCSMHLRTISESNKVGAKVAAAVGCTDPTTTLSCMKSKPVKELLEAGSKVAGSDIMTFVPSVGTAAVPLQGAEAMSTGKFIHVPLMNGGDKVELRLYVAYAAQAGKHVTPENYAETIRGVYGDKTPQVLAEYPISHYSSAPSAFGSIMSDFTPVNGLNNCLYLKAARLASRYIHVYEFEFADPNPPPVTADPGFEMGAVHSSELPYQFPNFSNTTKMDGPKLTPGAQKLSDVMLTAWSRFAWTGVPQDKELPAWTPFESPSHIMRFQQGKLGYFDAEAEHHCAFWKGLYPSLL